MELNDYPLEEPLPEPPTDVIIPVLSEEEMAKLKEEVKLEMRAERLERMKSLGIEYRVPITKFAKADMVAKVTGCAKGMGFAIQKDVIAAMGLQKGQMLKVTLELFPDDAAKLFSTL